MPFFYKYFVGLILLLFCLSCKKETNINPENLNAVPQDTIAKVSNKITKKNVSALNYKDYRLSKPSSAIIVNWTKFFELEKEIEKLKKADLSTFTQNDSHTVLSSFFADFKNEIPRQLFANQIKSRMLVLETFFFELQDLMNYSYTKTEVLKCIKKILEAHANLIYHINKKVEKDAQDIIKPL